MKLSPFKTWQTWAVLAASVLAFIFYAFFRVRYVGGCDSWAYLSQSLIFRGIDPGLSTTLDPLRHPALTPLCHELVGDKFLPIFPPGYPVLLAIGGLFGLEFLVNPLLAAASILLIYALIAPRAGRSIALALSILWAFTPMVIWGGTMVMSDLPAAFFALLAVFFFERNRPVAAGFALGMSLGIRPTNIVLALALLVPAFQRAQLRKFSLAFFVPGLLWAIYSYLLSLAFGPSGYVTNTGNLGFVHFFYQLAYLSRETWTMLAPLVLLAVATAIKRPAKSLSYLLWFGTFLLLYALWTAKFHAWWNTRYLLPAYPAIFVLAAISLRDLIRWCQPRLPRISRLLPIAGATACALMLVYQFNYAKNAGLLTTDFERGYSADAKKVAALVPPDALVGSLNFSGPLRLYGKLESFSWIHPRSIELIEWALAKKRPVYMVIEPWDRGRQEMAIAIEERFQLEPVTTLSMWHGLVLHRLSYKLLP